MKFAATNGNPVSDRWATQLSTGLPADDRAVVFNDEGNLDSRSVLRNSTILDVSLATNKIDTRDMPQRSGR